MENQVYVSGDLLNMINREEMMRLNNDLLTKFLDECMKNEYDFKMNAYLTSNHDILQCTLDGIICMQNIFVLAHYLLLVLRFQYRIVIMDMSF